jgi:esterase/lipase superfamily enzyme
MNIKSHRPLRKHFDLIKENAKQAKGYLDQGKISKEDLDSLLNADPTKQKKYVGWMAKMWIAEKPDFDDLRNTIEEYDTLLNKGKIKTKDINQFKSFKDLHSEVDAVNKSGEAVSTKDLENDYETIVDDSNLLIMVPHTHEASRKLGLSKFAFRDCEDGTKDSAWCTTYKAPDHFNDYYYENNVTFYYIRVKSAELVQKLKAAFPKKYKQLEVVALAVLEDDEIDGYDGLDKQMDVKEIKKYTSIIGIS